MQRSALIHGKMYLRLSFLRRNSKYSISVNKREPIKCLLTFTKRTMRTERKVMGHPMLLTSNVDPLIDEIIDIKSEGWRPNAAVTVRAVVSICKPPILYHSFGHFRADAGGMVDLSSHSPLDGTYSCVDPMGLFWSMEMVKGQRRGLRIFQRDSRQPIKVNLELYRDFIDFDVPIGLLQKVARNSDFVEAVELNRRYLSNNVERYDVKSGRLRGKLFVPKNSSKAMPGIIDVYGACGGVVEFRAALLASHGFVTLALPYFAYDDLPRKLENVDIEYFDEAVDWLCQHPKVKPGGMGMMGTSKGGELSLLTASRKHEVKAVVGLGCSYYHILSGILIKGKPSPYVPYIGKFSKFSAKGFMSTRDSFIDPDDPIKTEFAIPVEDIVADLLLIGGEDDQTVNSIRSFNVIKQRMERHGKGHQCTILAYPNAGHVIEPPYMPMCSGEFLQTYGVKLNYGGEKRGHSFAQKDSWQKIIQFFKEKL